MPRPSLGPGEPGEFSAPKWNPDRRVFQVHCLIGEPIGKPRKLHAQGATERKATAALQRKIKAWKPRAFTALGAYSPDCTVAELVRAWMHTYERDPSKRPQDARTYRQEIEPSTGPRAKASRITIVGSDLGRKKMRDVLPYHVRLHLVTLNGFSTKQAKQKSVLSMAFQMAFEDGFIDFNPVANVKGLRGTTAPPRNPRNLIVNPYFPEEPTPFNDKELALYWDLESAYFAPEHRHLRRDPKFRDFTRLLYDTAGRPGEVVATRWADGVDLDAGTVTTTGTVVDTELRVWQIRKVIADYQLADNEVIVSGGWRDRPDDDILKVIYRQPFTKTYGSMDKTVMVAAETLAMLKRRKLAAAPGQTLVIPSKKGKVLRAALMALVWQRVVKGSELEWSTPRTLRSTRATQVAEQYGLPAARLILGHDEDSPVTSQRYVPKSALKGVVSFPQHATPQ